MQLSDQALGAVMLALQNSLMNQTDIVPVLKEFNFTETDGTLVVENPPIVNMGEEQQDTVEGDDSVVFDAILDAIV
jgi:hypothetical protein|tara:strand:- start:438 stop:665 length:228 start_codon:yes stop_codon:yes gene_type:complete